MKAEFIRRMAGLRTATRRVETGASAVEVAEAPLGHGRIRIERGSRGSLEFVDDASGTGIHAKRYPALSTRPSDYPEDLPFFPNQQCSVMVLPEKRRRILSWTSDTGPAAVIAQLDAAVLDLGWQNRSRRRWFFRLLGEAAEYERGDAALSTAAYRLSGGATKVQVVADTSAAIFDPA